MTLLPVGNGNVSPLMEGHPMSSKPSDRTTVKAKLIACGALGLVAIITGSCVFNTYPLAGYITLGIGAGISLVTTMVYKILIDSNQAAKNNFPSHRPEIKLFGGSLPIPKNVVDIVLSFIQDRPTIKALSQISYDPNLQFCTFFKESHHHHLRCYEEEPKNLKYFFDGVACYEDQLLPNVIFNVGDVLRYDMLPPPLNAQFANYMTYKADLKGFIHFKSSVIKEIVEAFEEAGVSALRSDLSFNAIVDVKDRRNENAAGYIVNAMGCIIFHGKITTSSGYCTPFLLFFIMFKMSKGYFRRDRIGWDIILSNYSNQLGRLERELDPNLSDESLALIRLSGNEHQYSFPPPSLAALIQGEPCPFSWGRCIHMKATMQICPPSAITTHSDWDFESWNERIADTTINGRRKIFISR